MENFIKTSNWKCERSTLICSGWCVEEDAEKCGDLLTLVGYVFTLIANDDFLLESFVVFDAYGYG